MPETTPVKVQYVNEKLLGYVHHNKCRICNAVDRDKKSLREEVDNMAITQSYMAVCQFLAGHSIFIDTTNVARHIAKHAPYILEARKNGTKKMQSMIIKIKQTKTEVSEALQHVIDIGDTKVMSGDMPVTESLYIAALREQGKRGGKTTIEAEFETLDADFVNKIKALNGGTQV